MARGRMLNRTICTNEEIDAIITKLGFRAGMFVTWMIPHLDVEGRMTGNPAAVRAAVVPLRIEEFSVELVEQILQAAHDSGVLKWYTVDDKRFVWFPGFDSNQVGLRKDREQPSSFPPPPCDPDQVRTDSGEDPDQVRTGSGVGPDEVRLNGKESESKSEGNAAAPPADTRVARAEKARRELMPGASPQVVAALVAECPAVDVAEDIGRAIAWVNEHPKSKPKNWSAFLRKWVRRSDGRPEGGKTNGDQKPIGPPPKQEPSRAEKDAANAKLMEEQRKRLGF